MAKQMTRRDHQRLYTALAFFAVSRWQKAQITEPFMEEIRKLSGLVEEICFSDENKPGDSSAAAIDEAIDKHIEELDADGSTALPTERGSLIEFYDRLQTRKMRREQAAFYA